MAYIDSQQDQTKRNTAIIGVVAIHAMLGYALVSGLAMNVIETVRTSVDTFDVKDEPLPPPPPPPPPPQNDEIVDPIPTSPPVQTPPNPLPLPNNNPLDTIPFDPARPLPDTGPLALPDPGPATPLPSATPKPEPKPAFLPKAPSPSNDQMGWVTASDYPGPDLRRGNEGTTSYRLVVGTNGRVSACEATRSSGHPGLDRAACKSIERRARFDPATNENGAKVVGTFNGTVSWRIPK